MALDTEHPHWKRMRFKRNKVWMAVDAQEQPVIRNGKTLIKFQLDQPHEYWVHPSSVVPLAATAATGATPAKKNPPARKKPAPASEAVTAEACNDALCIFTDGACSGNPGPAGIGVVLRYKTDYKEISRYIGEATNNIAELEAIRTALQAVKNHSLPVIIFTDSSYAVGLLSRGWKAKQNTALVAEIRKLMVGFKNLRFVKVKGHAGHPDNERADRLAVASLQADA